MSSGRESSLRLMKLQHTHDEASVLATEKADLEVERVNANSPVPHAARLPPRDELVEAQQVCARRLEEGARLGRRGRQRLAAAGVRGLEPNQLELGRTDEPSKLVTQHA
jgi:hypothetical protein